MNEESATLLSRAEQLLQGRRHAITALETASTGLDVARTKFADAEREMSEAVKVAIDAGWTPGELRQLGITTEPARRPRTTKKRASSAGADSAPR